MMKKSLMVLSVLALVSSLVSVQAFAVGNSGEHYEDRTSHGQGNSQQAEADADTNEGERLVSYCSKISVQKNGVVICARWDEATVIRDAAAPANTGCPKLKKDSEGVVYCAN
jgi:hypothetical protein